VRVPTRTKLAQKPPPSQKTSVGPGEYTRNVYQADRASTQRPCRSPAPVQYELTEIAVLDIGDATDAVLPAFRARCVAANCDQKTANHQDQRSDSTDRRALPTSVACTTGCPSPVHIAQNLAQSKPPTESRLANPCVSEQKQSIVTGFPRAGACNQDNSRGDHKT